MKRPALLLGMALVFAGLLFVVASPTAAQAPGAHKLPNLPVKPTPRTADGHPDLSGMWIEGYNVDSFYFNDPFPYSPEAAKKVRQLYQDSDKDPLLHCQPYGYPRVLGGNHPVQVTQSANQMIVLYERDTTFRVFPLDGRPHWENADPSWMGDSVGHWEGNTLVVDITSFNDLSWLGGEGTGTFHSDALHVIEKYTRSDSNNMDIAFTMDDPKVFTHPYQTTHHMHLVPDEHFYEDITCTNEKDLAHAVRRPDDVPKNNAGKLVLLEDVQKRQQQQTNSAR